MYHQVLKFYQYCSFDAFGLLLTFFMARSNIVNANTLDFMESFECFGKKMVIRVALMSTLRSMSRTGQGHCLTFDPGLS